MPLKSGRIPEYVNLFVGANVAGTVVENKNLVSAVQDANNEWSKEVDSTGNILQYDLVASVEEINGVLNDLNVQPTGFIFEDHDSNGTWSDEKYHGAFDFTIIDEIDLSQIENLVSLASEHKGVWFQQANLSDGRYVWALSVENKYEHNQSDSSEYNMMVDLNGSVFFGHFHAYWRDAFDTEIEGNESSGSWREERFAATVEGIESLYQHFPVIRGLNAPKPPIVRTMSNPVVQNNTVFVSGEMLSDGNNDDLELGMEFSSSLRFANPIRLGSQNSDEMFEVSFDLSKHQSKYLYYRAYAKNQEFESFGATKRLKMDELQNSFLTDAKKLDGGWESSDWFGTTCPMPMDGFTISIWVGAFRS